MYGRKLQAKSSSPLRVLDGNVKIHVRKDEEKRSIRHLPSVAPALPSLASASENKCCNREAVARAIQRRLDTGEYVGVVIKMLARDPYLLRVKAELSALVSEWMGRWGFSFASLERADLVISHENFKQYLNDGRKLFSEEAVKGGLRGSPSPRTLQATSELCGIIMSYGWQSRVFVHVRED